MAKKKNLLQINDWTEVDGALRRLGEINIEVEKQDGKLTLEINQLKDKFTERVNPLLAEHKCIENGIKAFVLQHKSEFANIRTREFNFGEVGFHVASKVVVTAPKVTIAALKELGLKACLNIEESLNKDQLKTLSDAVLAKVGARKETVDNLTIKPNIDRIKENC